MRDNGYPWRLDLLHNPRIPENYPHLPTLAFLGIAWFALIFKSAPIFSGFFWKPQRSERSLSKPIKSVLSHFLVLAWRGMGKAKKALIRLFMGFWRVSSGQWLFYFRCPWSERSLTVLRSEYSLPCKKSVSIVSFPQKSGHLISEPNLPWTDLRSNFWLANVIWTLNPPWLNLIYLHVTVDQPPVPLGKHSYPIANASIACKQ